jgi:CheY-like chemotaxis protein
LGKRSQINIAPRRTVLRDVGDIVGAKVLCMENEPAVLAGMQALLKGWGCEVWPAASLEAAQDYLTPPDLILVDYHLDNGEDGIHAVRLLHAQWKREVPGIVITADHTLAAKQAAAAQGYALLPKPVKPAALRALISRVLMQRGRD